MNRGLRWGITGFVLILSVVFLAVGVWRGEMEIVLRKAVNVCMECIGLG